MSDLSDNDKKRISLLSRINPIISYLSNLDKVKFKIGDILIKKTMRVHDDDKFHIETVSKSNLLPRRYVYFYECPTTGVGFIKPLMTKDGSESKQIFCMADFNLSVVQFEVDPLYVESILLGDGTIDYKSINAAEVQRVKDIKRRNKEASFTTKSLKELNHYLLTNFRIGDTIYYHHPQGADNFKGESYKKIHVTDMESCFFSKIPQSERWKLLPYINSSDTKTVLRIKGQHGGRMFSTLLLDSYIYKSPPVSVHDKELG